MSNHVARSPFSLNPELAEAMRHWYAEQVAAIADTVEPRFRSGEFGWCWTVGCKCDVGATEDVVGPAPLEVFSYFVEGLVGDDNQLAAGIALGFSASLQGEPCAVLSYRTLESHAADALAGDVAKVLRARGVPTCPGRPTRSRAPSAA